MKLYAFNVLFVLAFIATPFAVNAQEAATTSEQPVAAEQPAQKAPTPEEALAQIVEIQLNVYKPVVADCKAEKVIENLPAEIAKLQEEATKNPSLENDLKLQSQQTYLFFCQTIITLDDAITPAGVSLMGTDAAKTLMAAAGETNARINKFYSTYTKETFEVLETLFGPAPEEFKSKVNGQVLGATLVETYMKSSEQDLMAAFNNDLKKVRLARALMYTYVISQYSLSMINVVLTSETIINKADEISAPN